MAEFFRVLEMLSHAPGNGNIEPRGHVPINIFSMHPRSISRRPTPPLVTARKPFASAIVLVLAAGTASAQSLAITGAVAYPSASAAPIPRATVLLKDGRIVAIGNQVRIPAGYDTIRCEGCAIVAGFWNSHVHFTEPKWDAADKQPAGKLRDQLQAMLTKSGFTTVVDTGSLPANTAALRRRIDSGEVPGPRILTAGAPVYPPDGIPYYVKESLPPELVRNWIPPRDAGEAVAAVDANIRGGADIIKLFTGSWISRGTVLPMPEAIATAAVTEAHRSGRLVFSHSSNLAGTEVAIASRVDVLAHAPEDTRGIDDALLKRAVAQGMTMIPTLKLFSGDDNIAQIRGMVRRFHQLGGNVVFGTDTGYLTDYDVGEEFAQLGKAGFSWSEILSLLTENPARLFKDQENRGRVAPGMIADLTVLEADPASDPSAFFRVRYTIRNGRVVYSSR
jgi:imidazolonepropionase-like amidohydrolase